MRLNTELDSESTKFIEWVMEKLQNEEFYNQLILEITNNWNKFVAQNKETLLVTLEKKLIKGGLEHGNPTKYTPEEIDEELSKEFTDLLGWTLIGRRILSTAALSTKKQEALEN